MIDALLFAVRDALRGAGFGYGTHQCEVMADGMPPPSCGKLFVAVHEGPSRNAVMNYLDEYFSFMVTLTMRVDVPPDRVGDTLLARKVARTPGPNGQPSFNARAEQLRSFLHMAWGVIQDANTLLVSFEPSANAVYGFCEPAHFAGMEKPHFVTGEWFSAAPEAGDVGLAAELRFEDCRRLQAIATYV